MYTLKYPMITKLAIIKSLKDDNNVDILYDEIVPNLKFQMK